MALLRTTHIVFHLSENRKRILVLTLLTFAAMC